MKGFRTIVMTAIVAPSLIGCAQGVPLSPSPAPSADLSAGSPSLVTGQLAWNDMGVGWVEWQKEVPDKGGVRQRVRKRTARSEMNDARLTGTVTVTDNADRFTSDSGQSVRGEVLWGTVDIKNDQGTWTGTLTGTTDLSAKGRGTTYIELVGAGAYEGLSAVLFERETATTIDWNGVIFPGVLPPDR